MNAVARAKGFAVRQLANVVTTTLPSVSDANILRMVTALQAVAPTQAHKEQLRRLRTMLLEGAPCAVLARRIFREASPAARRAVVNNLGVNATYLGWPVRKARLDKGLAAPWLVVISPTMRCNLRCKGCYAGEYTKKDDLPLEIVDRVITEAKQMGIHFFTITGGEAFVRPDLFDIYEKHHDCSFLVYTNGTLIDKSVAQHLGRIGNVSPALSVEGFEKETDDRRGAGVWNRVMTAMDNLREAGVVFGYSATVTRNNVEVVTSDELVDHLIDKGCYFGWYFLYIPIGRNPDTSLMPTPEQRQYCRKRVWRCRAEKPIFLADFWSDGHLVGGCMSGGRMYLHVTASGDVEPCVFFHFAADNIKEKSLEEILDSDFFKAIRRRFPWTDNELAPCTIIDNPWVLREAVAEGHVHPSHPGAETIMTELAPDLDAYSKALHELTDDDPDAHIGIPWKTAEERVPVEAS